MSDQNLRLLAPQFAPSVGQQRLPLGRYLVENGIISPDQLVRALQVQLRLGAPVGEILVSEGWADEADIATALAQQHGVARADLRMQSADRHLADLMPHTFWLQHRVIPWIRLGRAILIATTRPDQFGDVRDAMINALGADCPDVLPVLACEAQIFDAIASRFAQQLAAAAGNRVESRFSCRTWRGYNRLKLSVVLLILLLAAVLYPLAVFGLLCLVAITTLTLFSALKLVGASAQLLSHGHLTAPHPVPVPGPLPGFELGLGSEPRPLMSVKSSRLPKVSILVPLFRETEIAGALVRRLAKLSYPKALLDVILVLEEHDALTRQTLDGTRLPPWMRVLEVPAHGGLTTKPRAMNYALDFCRGDIIGVWDAEDAPAADQIEQVVSHFARADDHVVCLQGILDFYNPRSNWLSRCFTIEYSSWFRIVLPGIARLGLVVPLGGTTLFFKRDKLEELGGWDAHNVTEDADLGVRLCRAGYRTELIDTVTHEEANCRAWPWVRQRSRWLKGFMITYVVHMRQPARLWSDLGARRFWGFQAFFLGTLGQFLLAPVLWSFWLVLFGVAHPVLELVPTVIVFGVAGLLGLSELLALFVGLVAVSRAKRRFLAMWVPTMMFYYPLGVIAAYKALYELLMRPFFWDKTQHGHAVEDTA